LSKKTTNLKNSFFCQNKSFKKNHFCRPPIPDQPNFKGMYVGSADRCGLLFYARSTPVSKNEALKSFYLGTSLFPPREEMNFPLPIILEANVGPLQQTLVGNKVMKWRSK
jgi:hypothetical protein